MSKNLETWAIACTWTKSKNVGLLSLFSFLSYFRKNKIKIKDEEFLKWVKIGH